MKVETRDTALKYPRAIKDEKIRLVLDWLLEFRFSSIDILAARLGQSSKNANRFFNSIIEQNLIMPFKNVHTKNQRYVMLTTSGASYLEAAGRDISSANTRVASLGKYSQIIHDLSVQVSVLNRLYKHQEIIWDRNIIFASEHNRPDALLYSVKESNELWSALEFERWRKDKKRIYLAFQYHVEHIKNKRYAGVHYLFESLADRNYYEKLFKEERWPQYKREKKSGSVKLLSSGFSPDSIPNLRRRFVFSHEPSGL